MASSGGLSCPDSDQRMNYYGMSGIPHVVFDGTVDMVGAGSDYVDGSYYMPIIDQRLLVDSPLHVAVTDVDIDNRTMSVRVELFADLASTAGTYIRAGICEDDLVYGSVIYHNTLRDMLTQTPLTISHTGEVQEITLPFTMGGTWNPDNLWFFAFVQRDSDQRIYNAGTSKVGAYAVRVGVANQQAILDGPTLLGPAVIFNVGIETDTLDLTLDQSDLPEGWSAYFSIDGNDYTETSITLAQFESAELTVTMTPGVGLGSGRAILTVHSQSGEMEDVLIEFAGIVGGTDLLVVSYDGPADYAYDYFGPAIDTTGRSYAVWDRDLSSVETTTLLDYQAVIWFSGDDGPGFDEDDRGVIEDFLNGGGRLFISGQNIARETFADGGGNWMINVLRSWFRHNDNGGPNLEGIAGDPISDGLTIDLVGGDGAGNYDDPDVMRPFGDPTESVSIFTYSGTANGGGNRVEYGGYKLVFLGFGFESINNVADRESLMERTLDWLLGSTPVGDGELPKVAALQQNAPNPFNPETTIAFDVARPGHVRVEVFDLKGRRVRVLVDEPLVAGRHSVVWDGQDDAGKAVASGTYFYRMTSGDRTLSRAMTLLK